MKVLNDPSSDFAQQLLTSEELEKQTVEPWWESSIQHPVPSSSVNGPKQLHRYGHKPEFVEIPAAAIKAAEGAGSSGPSLLHNICAVMCVIF